MSYKPDEKTWMAYLYDELDAVERDRMEKYLLTNAEARKQLEQFRNMRTLLSDVEDKEVIAPPIFVGNAQEGFSWNSSSFRKMIAVAASIALVMIAAKVANVKISMSNNQFIIAFGEQPQTQPAVDTSPKESPAVVLTPEEVQRMINNSVADHQSTIDQQLRVNKEKLDESIKSNLALSSERIEGLVQQASTASQEQIRQYLISLQTENMSQVKDYFQLTSTQQKQYLENILVDFAQYLQEQRNSDLKLVQSQMQNLEQNTNLLKQETEQILTSIITNVGKIGKGSEINN